MKIGGNGRWMALMVFVPLKAIGQTGVEDTILRGSIEEVVISDQSSDILVEEVTYSLSRIKQGVGNNFHSPTDFIREAPGVYVDGSLGEAYSRVFTRGVSASAEDDIGWYYNALYENNMPVTAIQYQYFTPDLFLRPGLHTAQLEAIRGGKSSVLFQNAPGGVFNFISQSPYTEKKTIESTFGILGKGNSYFKIEGAINENLGAGWALSGSAMYRHSNGHREVDYPWDKGGQIKASISKISGNQKWSVHASFLDDKIDRYTGIAATGWNDPSPAFGQDFNNTALMLPAFQSTIPGASGYTFDPEKGIAVKDFYLHGNHVWKNERWKFSTDIKYSNKNVDWQTSFGNNPLHLSDFLTYFISGDAFPVGLVQFEDARTGEVLATVNNVEAFNVFQGLPPGFEYVSGNLPHDAIMAIAPWKKEDKLKEFMFQSSANYESGKHQLHMGIFSSVSKVDYFTNASFAYATYEPLPRLLEVTLQDFDGSTRKLSDENGMSNYGALFYEKGEFNVGQYSLFINDYIDITENIKFDGGVRLEHIRHQVSQDIPEGIAAEGGLDNNSATSYDQGFMTSSGNSNDYDFDFTAVSGSGSIQYLGNNGSNVYYRFSVAHKVPELSFYTQNFSGAREDIQKLVQHEVGYKGKKTNINYATSFFYNVLSQINTSDFVFDQMTNELFYSPVQNQTHTIYGLEVEGEINISDHWNILGQATYQKPDCSTCPVYNAAGTVDDNDDTIDDFSGRRLTHIPNVMTNLKLQYVSPKLNTSLSWRVIGNRYANAENAFVLPSFHTFDWASSYAISQDLVFSFSVTNLFNSTGLMNFFGPNTFGGSANQATTSYINANPDASFVVFPVLPRAMYWRVCYHF